MKKADAAARISKLKAELTAANYAYFNGLSLKAGAGDTKDETLPEGVRDGLKAELIELETAFPELITPDSPSQRVGAALPEKAAKVTHKTQKWSLSDAFTKDDLRAWWDRMLKETEALRGTTAGFAVSAEAKIDGVSVTLWYDEGRLTHAITRGDGKFGEDITHTIKTSASVPLTLPRPITAEFTGECFLGNAAFQKINEKLPEEEQYANARNLAAGTVRVLDPEIARARGLQVALYTAGTVPEGATTQAELLEYFEALHLPHLPPGAVFTDFESLYTYCETGEKLRAQFDFAIDGIVVKVHDLELREDLGYTAKVQRGAIAWKFPAEEVTTTLTAVAWEVGRTGVHTPVAHLRPVAVAGSTVARATLHNMNYISEKQIMVGDSVIIRKAGDIIPEVVRPLLNLRPSDALPISAPTNCACGKPLYYDGPRLKCANDSCPSRVNMQIEYFAKTMQMDGVGGRTIDALLEAGLISSYVDLYSLTKADLLTLEGFKDKKAEKVLQSIETSKHTTAWRLLTALGVGGIGAENAKLVTLKLRRNSLIINYAKSNSKKRIKKEIQNQLKHSFEEGAEAQRIIEKVHVGLTQIGKQASLNSPLDLVNVQLTEEELLAIHGVGETLTAAFVAFQANETVREQMERLTAAGVQFVANTAAEGAGAIEKDLVSHIYVITGSFIYNDEKVSRDAIKAKLEARGAKVSSSISKNTTALLCGENAGSKRQKAEDLGVLILDHDQTLERVQWTSIPQNEAKISKITPKSAEPVEKPSTGETLSLF